MARQREVGLGVHGIDQAVAYGKRLLHLLGHRLAIVKSEAHGEAVYVHQSLVLDLQRHVLLSECVTGHGRHYLCHRQVNGVVTFRHLYTNQIETVFVGRRSTVEAQAEGLAGLGLHKEKGTLLGVVDGRLFPAFGVEG